MRTERSTGIPATRSFILRAGGKGQADLSLPRQFHSACLFNSFFKPLPSVRLPYPNRNREPGVRYGGRSAELVFRRIIAFDPAVIVVNFVHAGIVAVPKRPVKRPLAPVTVLRSKPVRCTRGVGPVKPGNGLRFRAIVLNPGRQVAAVIRFMGWI
jgi:hypothetical protein